MTLPWETPAASFRDEVRSIVDQRLAERKSKGNDFADATLLYGATIDLILAGLAGVYTVLNPASWLVPAFWVVVGSLAAKTVAQTGAAWWLREH